MYLKKSAALKRKKKQVDLKNFNKCFVMLKKKSIIFYLKKKKSITQNQTKHLLKIFKSTCFFLFTKI